MNTTPPKKQEAVRGSPVDQTFSSAQYVSGRQKENALKKQKLVMNNFQNLTDPKVLEKSSTKNNKLDLTTTVFCDIIKKKQQKTSEVRQKSIIH